MSKVEISITAITNLPPSSVGTFTVTIDHNNSKVFTGNNFTTDTIPQYADPEGDSPSRLRIDSLPVNGILEYNGTPVSVSDILTWVEVNDTTFIYTGDTNIKTSYTDTFTFSIADVGSEVFTSGGIVNITVNAFVNLPPTIGDNLSLTTKYGIPLTITANDLTVNTTPPYSDPEGDPPLAIRIKTLPNDGILKLQDIPVRINQIIAWEDITKNLLKFHPDNNIFTGYITGFDIQIADTGSGQFVD